MAPPKPKMPISPRHARATPAPMSCDPWPGLAWPGVTGQARHARAMPAPRPRHPSQKVPTARTMPAPRPHQCPVTPGLVWSGLVWFDVVWPGLGLEQIAITGGGVTLEMEGTMFTTTFFAPQRRPTMPTTTFSPPRNRGLPPLITSA
eukprot:gene14648-biopygen18652